MITHNFSHTFKLFFFASEPRQTGRELRMVAFKKNENAVENASQDSQRKKVMEAVINYGHALEFVSNRLQKNREFIKAAVKRSRFTLDFASETLQNDRKLALEAVEQIDIDMKLVTGCCPNNKKNVVQAVKQNELAMNLVENNFS